VLTVHKHQVEQYCAHFQESLYRCRLTACSNAWSLGALSSSLLARQVLASKATICAVWWWLLFNENHFVEFGVWDIARATEYR